MEEIRILKSIPLKGLRGAYATEVLGSLQIPMIWHISEVDMTEMIKLRESLVPEIEKKYGVHVNYTHFFLKVAAQALKEHPILNSVLLDEEIRVFEQVNIGLLLSLPPEDLIVAPVIRDVGKRSIVEIAQESNEIVKRLKTYDKKTGRYDIHKGDFIGATFNFSSLGMFGVKGLTFALLVSKQPSAILLTGGIEKKPVVRNDEITVRPIMTMTITVNHQVINGVTMVKFVQACRDIMENPQKLELGI